MFRDDVCEISVNIDDMTGEEIGFLLEQMMREGALDAWATPIFMKKQRPAYAISVLCTKVLSTKICELFFKHTTTMGLRFEVKDRIVMPRSIHYIQTSFGTVRVKYADGKRQLEYDDVAKIAKETGKSLNEVKEIILGDMKE